MTLLNPAVYLIDITALTRPHEPVAQRIRAINIIRRIALLDTPMMNIPGFILPEKTRSSFERRSV